MSLPIRISVWHWRHRPAFNSLKIRVAFHSDGALKLGINGGLIFTLVKPAISTAERKRRVRLIGKSFAVKSEENLSAQRHPLDFSACRGMLRAAARYVGVPFLPVTRPKGISPS